MADWLEGQDYSRGVLEYTLSDTAVVFQLAGDRTADFPAAPFILTLFDAAAYRSPVEASEAGAIEKVLVTVVTLGAGTRLTVTRAYDGTTAREWPAGTAIWVAVNWAVIDQIHTAIRLHNHTNLDALQGSSALIPASVAASTFVTAASYMTAATYIQVGSYLKGYNDASALYGGATGGVLELTQGAPSGAAARSKVLMWCRDGIVNAAQIAFAPVHQNTDAGLRFVLFPKGTPADGAGFTIFGNGSATRWANFYCTTTDAGIAVQNGITTLSFRNGHSVTDPLSMQLDLVNDLLTFSGDAIVGRGAANRIDIGTSGAPDDLMVWGSKIEVGSTVRIDRDQDNSLGLAAGDQIWADNMLALARANLVERIYDICDPANIRALWIPDGRTGTTLKDWSGNARAATIGTNLTTAVAGHCRYLPMTADGHGWEVADADWQSFGDGSTDTAFTILSLVYPTVDVGTTTVRTIFGRQNGQTSLREYRFNWTGQYIFSRYFDNSAGSYIGRRSDGPPTGNTWQVMEASYDGSATNAGCKIYVGNTQVDTTNSNSGSYTAMENLALAGGSCYVASNGSKPCFRGRNAVTLLLTGQLTATQRARLNVLLLGFAGSSIV